MKKLCVFIISMFFCLTSLYAANQTNANTIKEDLKCFYTRLDKENIFILDTDKFKCTNGVCVSSDFNKIGILNTNEYERVGGSTSYLVNRLPFVTLGNNGYDVVTSNEIRQGESEGGLRPVLVLEEGLYVIGSGTKRDPWILVASANGVNFIPYINNTRVDNIPNSTDKYLFVKYNCSKNVETNYVGPVYGDTLSNLGAKAYTKNATCNLYYKDGYKVTFKYPGGSSNYTNIGPSKKGSISKLEINGYTWENASVSCNNGVTANIEDTKITVDNVTKDSVCTVNLSMLPTVTMTATNGSVVAPVSKTLPRLGDNLTFTVTANSYYQTSGATVSCTKGSTISLSGNTVTVSNITKNDTCRVNMAPQTYNVTLSVVNGSGNTTKGIKYGSTGTFTVSAYSDYTTSGAIVSCNGGASGSISGNTVTIRSVNKAQTCTVTMALAKPIGEYWIANTDGYIREYTSSGTLVKTMYGSSLYLQYGAYYYIEAYGGQGDSYGYYSGGSGGRATGYATFSAGTTLYLYAGSQGGGGRGAAYGGASSRVVYGNTNILIAAGGGGASSDSYGGDGGNGYGSGGRDVGDGSGSSGSYGSGGGSSWDSSQYVSQTCYDYYCPYGTLRGTRCTGSTYSISGSCSCYVNGGRSYDIDCSTNDCDYGYSKDYWPNGNCPSGSTWAHPGYRSYSGRCYWDGDFQADRDSYDCGGYESVSGYPGSGGSNSYSSSYISGYSSSSGYNTGNGYIKITLQS